MDAATGPSRGDQAVTLGKRALEQLARIQKAVHDYHQLVKELGGHVKQQQERIEQLEARANLQTARIDELELLLEARTQRTQQGSGS